jgi:hypothetical protein
VTKLHVRKPHIKLNKILTLHYYPGYSFHVETLLAMLNFSAPVQPSCRQVAAKASIQILL